MTNYVLPILVGCVACGSATITPEPLHPPSSPAATAPAEVDPPVEESNALGALVLRDGENVTDPQEVSGEPVVMGRISKDAIQQTIRRHNARMRYCYEKELQKNPDLKGKITIKFVINPTGAVSSAVVRETTMNNSPVEQCVVAVTREMQFPKPTGGGIVVVSYPYIFKSSDSVTPQTQTQTATPVPGHGAGIGGLGLSGSGGGGSASGLGSLAGAPGSGGGRAATRSRVKVRSGSVSVQGGLDKAVVRRVLRRRQNAYRYCYERQLQKDQSLEGRVVVEFVINGQGRVAAAKIDSSTLRNNAAEKCMVSQTRRLRFPKPKGGETVKVKYPFMFTSVVI